MKDISTCIARFLLKISNKNDNESLERWSKHSEQNLAFLKNMDRFWNSPSEIISNETRVPARERLISRMNDLGVIVKTRSKTIYFIGRVAAILVFTISIASLSIYFAAQSDIFYQKNWVEISTEAGQQSKINLPDGTLVWLNSHSVIKYHPNKKSRKVELSGEAYFEVSHAADYPFVVETEQSNIKVLGTKFNVSNYPELHKTEASLIEGRIEFSAPGIDRTLKLSPGEKIVFNQVKQTIVKSSDKVDNDILWRQGILSFENEPFNQLIFKLENYYDVKFSYDKKVFNAMHYTGYIDNLSITNVLDFITMTIPMEYQINNKSITLKIKPMKNKADY